MDQERYRVFLNSLYQPTEGLMADMEQEALDAFVPIIRKDTQQYLITFLEMYQPSRILEIGTAVGFSGSLMLRQCPDAHLTTIENWEPRYAVAEANFRRAGVWERAHFIHGDAEETLRQMTAAEGTETYDLIFLDAAKGQYPALLPYIKKLMHKGSVLLTDNVLQEGEILESKFVVERRDRTIHKRMREYLYLLTHDDSLLTSVLSVGDGLSVTVMR